jgi:hypothetical protein
LISAGLLGTLATGALGEGKMGGANFSRFSALVNCRLLADPDGTTLDECVAEAEKKNLDVHGDRNRQTLEMGVETVLSSLYHGKHITPRPVGEKQQEAFELWQKDWFAKQGEYERIDSLTVTSLHFAKKNHQNHAAIFA